MWRDGRTQTNEEDSQGGKVIPFDPARKAKKGEDGSSSSDGPARTRADAGPAAARQEKRQHSSFGTLPNSKPKGQSAPKVRTLMIFQGIALAFIFFFVILRGCGGF